MKSNGSPHLTVAKLLIDARVSGPISELPDNCRPSNMSEVYAIHDAVAAELGPVLGWKVGAKMQRQNPFVLPCLMELFINHQPDLTHKNFPCEAWNLK